MYSLLRILCASLLAACAAQVQAAPANRSSLPVSVGDIVEFKRLVTPDERSVNQENPVFPISPDGRYLAMVTRQGNVASNRNEYALLLYRMEDIRRFVNGRASLPMPQPRELLKFRSSSTYVFEHAIRDVKWLPDSRHVTFLGEDEDAPTQVYRLDVESGERTQLTRHPSPVLSYEHHVPTGTTLYLFRKDLGIPGSDKASFVADVNTINQLVSRDRPENFGIQYQMAIVDADAPGGYRRLGEAFPGQMPPVIAISPSGRYAVSRETVADLRENAGWMRTYPVTARYQAFVDVLTKCDPVFMRCDNGLLSRVAIYNLKTEERTVLKSIDGSLVAGNAVGEHWLDDTRVILANTFIPTDDNVVSGSVRDENGEILPVVAEYDVVQKGWRIIQRLQPAIPDGDRKARFTGIEIMPSGALKVATAGGDRYYARDAEVWRAVAQKENTPSAALGTQLRFSIEQTRNVRPDAFAFDPVSGKKRRFTNHNPRFDTLQSSRAELFAWKDSRGRSYESQLVLPVRHDPRRRYPLVIQTYGADPYEFVLDGGRGTSSTSAVRVWAGHGMMVLILPQLPGGQDREELLHYREMTRGALDALNGRGWIDPQRVGITGFSAMGQVVRDLITFSEIPIAAATIADAWNPSLFGYMAYNFGFVGAGVLSAERVIGARPWGSELKTWVERDPMLHTDRVKAPVRLEHYGDYVPPHWDLYVLLRRQHRPVELVWFPRPSAHQLRRPDQRMDSLQGNTDWFRFWLKDEEDKDAAKAEQYRRWREMKARKPLD